MHPKKISTQKPQRFLGQTVEKPGFALGGSRVSGVFKVKNEEAGNSLNAVYKDVPERKISSICRFAQKPCKPQFTVFSVNRCRKLQLTVKKHGVTSCTDAGSGPS